MGLDLSSHAQRLAEVISPIFADLAALNVTSFGCRVPVVARSAIARKRCSVRRLGRNRLTRHTWHEAALHPRLVFLGHASPSIAFPGGFR